MAIRMTCSNICAKASTSLASPNAEFPKNGFITLVQDGNRSHVLILGMMRELDLGIIFGCTSKSLFSVLDWFSDSSVRTAHLINQATARSVLSSPDLIAARLLSIIDQVLLKAGTPLSNAPHRGGSNMDVRLSVVSTKCLAVGPLQSRSTIPQTSSWNKVKTELMRLGQLIRIIHSPPERLSLVWCLLQGPSKTVSVSRIARESEFLGCLRGCHLQL